MSLPRNLGKNVFSQGKTHPQDLALLSEGINEKKMLAAISVSKGCCSHQASTATLDGEP